MRRLLLYSAAATAPLLALLAIHLHLENGRLAGRAEAAETANGTDASAPTAPSNAAKRGTPGRIHTRPATRVSPSSRPRLGDLLAELEGTDNTQERVRLLRQIGELRDPASVLHLKPWLVEKTPHPVRFAAAEAIGRSGGEDATTTLKDLLMTRDHTQVGLGAGGLAVMNGAGATEALIAALGDPRTARFRTSILSALGARGDEHAVGALTATLYEGNRSVRSAAASSLGRIKAGVSVLLGAVEDDSNLLVQRAALQALRDSKESRVDELVTAILNDPRSPLRDIAIGMLGSRKELRRLALLSEIIRTGSREDRQAALNALGETRDPRAVKLLQESLSRVPKNQRHSVVYALSRVKHPSAKEALRALLGHGNTDIQRTVANAISWNHPELLAELDPAQSSPDIQPAIFRALVQINGEGALPMLKAAAGSNDMRLATAAMRALGELGSLEARTVLLDTVAGGEGQVAQAALQAVGGLAALDDRRRAVVLAKISAGDVTSSFLYSLGRTGGSADVRDALVGALKNGDRNLQHAVTSALVRSGGPGTVPLLEQAANDTTLGKNARNAALNALGQAGTPEANAVLISLAGSGNKGAISALRNVGTPEAVTTLTGLISSKDTSQATAALAALGSIRTPEATEALITALDGEKAVARQAVYSLGGRRSPEARAALLDIALQGNDELRTAALGTLGYNATDREALPVIESALKSESSSVAMAAVGALSYRQGSGSSDLLGEVLDMEGVPINVRKRAAQVLKQRGGAAARHYKDSIDDLMAPTAGTDTELPISVVSSPE